MIGTQLAHYQISGLLGKGGMGEVYRATDSRLEREVALKLLPPDFAADPDRVARFRREARLLAALNHQNIAAIHGLEEDQGRIFLAMELVIGPTVGERIQAGPMPVDEALAVAAQIARGLEAAHAKGIVHRDLKPANVKLGPEGEVKILDFGLARAYLGEDRTEANPADSPTMTAAMTQAGMILGTASYMSPEQARGQEVDSRTDVWAFGVILWELLTGRSLFDGGTVSDTLAMVLRSEPDWDALPDALPPAVTRLVRRCLQRDRRQRLHHIADARIVLEEIQRDGTSAHLPDSGVVRASDATSPRSGRVGWFVAAAMAVAVLILSWRTFTSSPTVPAPPVAFDLAVDGPRWIAFVRQAVAVSPDGEVIVVSLQSEQGSQLHRRRLDDPALEAIAGTEDGNTPFFSPDGRWIAFTQDDRLRKIPLSGGTPVDLVPTEWGGGVWTSDGRIIFTRSYAGGLDVVSADGGEVTPLTEPDMSRNELGHWWPQLLPGEEWLLYTSWSSPIDSVRVMAFCLATGEHRELLKGGTFGRWSPTGHLLWARSGQLLAAPFSLDRMQVTGPAEPVLDDIFMDPSDGYTDLDFSRNGTLIYVPGSVMNAPSDLVWVDRQGEISPLDIDSRNYQPARLSPDGRLLAVTIGENQNNDIWLHDLQRGIWSRFTFSPASDFNPVWSPDGQMIYFNGEEPQFTIYRRPADGSTEPELILREPIDTMPTCVTPDGRSLVCTYADPETDSDIWIVPVDDPGAARPFLATRFSEAQGVISPDGRWLAYVSNESGGREIYAMAFPDGGSRVRISIDGGHSPSWSPLGDELFFMNGGGVLSAAVARDPSDARLMVVGRPVELFRGPFPPFWIGASYSVAADAQRLLMQYAPLEVMPRRLRVVANWFGELEARLGEK